MSIKDIIMLAAGNIVAIIKSAWALGFTTSTVYYINDIKVDSNGNTYAALMSIQPTGALNPSQYSMGVAKMTASGTLLWHKYLSYADSATGYGVDSDASGNIYILGRMYNYLSATYDAVLVKLDSTGNLLWQKNFRAGVNSIGFHVKVVGSNIYAGGYFESDKFIICFDPTGIVQWKSISNSGGSNKGYDGDIAVDSNNNLYMVGYVNIASVPYGVITKFNSAGIIQWEKRLSTGSLFKGVEVDTANNIIVVGQIASNMQFIIKIDSTGSIIWQKTSPTATYSCFNTVKSDNLNNYYVGGRRGGVTNYIPVLVSFNSAGTVGFGRTLSWTGNPSSSRSTQVQDIDIINGDSIICSIQNDDYSPTGPKAVARLPIDGTSTGSWNPVNYVNSVETYTASAYTLVSVTPGVINNTFTSYMIGSIATTSMQRIGMTELSNGNLLTTSGSGISSGTYNTYIMQYSATGIVGNGFSCTPTTNGFTGGGDVVVDANGNIYCQVFGTGQTLNKFNSSLVLQWVRMPPTTVQPGKILLGANHIYYCIAIADVGAQPYGLILKYDFAGTLVWQRKILATYSTNINTACLDSAENVIICGQYRESSTATSKAYLAKYNSAGTLQWDNKLYTTTVSQDVYAVAVDSTDNIYLSSNQFTNSYIISKFDSAGNIVWQKSAGTTFLARFISYDSVNNTLILSGGDRILTLDVAGNILNQIQMTQTNTYGGIDFNYVRYLNGFLLMCIAFYSAGSGSYLDYYLLKVSINPSGTVGPFGNINNYITFATPATAITLTAWNVTLGGATANVKTNSSITITVPSTYFVANTPGNVLNRKILAMPYSEDSTAYPVASNTTTTAAFTKIF